MTDATRKIAVIVALDVAGYSARTEADETKTTTEVAALRQVIEGIAKAHGGRVFNTAGDGFMLEFASSLAAVEAAGDLAAKCEPRVRVGVHLGDVVVQPNGDLLGHGVNVAARLMARSDPGAALISADVRRTIRGPLADRLVSRGLMQLDKMAETIEAFALGARAPISSKAPSASVEPVLAVLPFDNMSDDKEMQFFSDGVSEEILQTIARAKGLRVIGKASSFQLRGPDKSVRKAVADLGATHVVDGSVRRAGNHVRVNVQLVEGRSQTTLWTDRYDRQLDDVFQLQDDIASTIADALNARLAPSFKTQAVAPEIFDLYLRARGDLTRDWSPVEAQRAIRLLEEAVAREPKFAKAWGFLGALRAVQFPSDHDIIGEPEHQAAAAAVQRALAIDPDCMDAVGASVALLPAFSNYAEKLRITERAVGLAPNDTTILSLRGFALDVVGRLSEALDVKRRMAQIDPLQSWPHAQYAAALHAVGQTDAAFQTTDDALRRFPDALWVRLSHMMLLTDCGRNDESMEIAATTVIPEQIAGLPFGQRLAAQLNGFVGLLKLAGLPQAERHGVFQNLLTADPLGWFVCEHAARLGLEDLVFERLLPASKRRQITAGAGSRWFTARALFVQPNSALRRDPRFAIVCAHLGLVDHWQQSGHWPDCTTQVPYDFKAECEKAAREIAKA
jgi:adenylate cyclase